MYSSDPLPVRVLVKGASTVSWISWMGGPRTDFAFPRAVEAALLAQGRPAEARSTAILGDPTRAFFKTFEEDVLQWSPDVVVIVAGHYEVLHLFLPHWFERHANRVNVPSGRIRGLYRSKVLRPFWKLAATFQSKVDAPLDSGPNALRLRKRRLRRAAADVEAYIGQVQQVGSPLVLLLELLPVAPKQTAWFPGMTPRIRVMNQLNAELVERIGKPHVRFFRTSEVSTSLYGDDQAAATPDGFHFTPELHRAIGAELAEQIAAWAETQPHLATGRNPQPQLAPARDISG